MESNDRWNRIRPARWFLLQTIQPFLVYLRPLSVSPVLFGILCKFVTAFGYGDLHLADVENTGFSWFPGNDLLSERL